MEARTGKYTSQYHGESADHRHTGTRPPWERLEHREPDRVPVTLWVGFSRVVAAVEIPNIDPDEIAVSVQEDSLMFRGTGRFGFTRDVPLPFAVESNPVLVARGKGILYAILVKKQAPDPSMAA